MKILLIRGKFMKKIVMLNFCNGLYGGIESFLLNAFYCLNPSEYEVVFLTCGKTTYSMYQKDIELKGGRIEEIPILANSLDNKFRIFFALKNYFANNRPDIVHINSGTLMLHVLAVKAAKDTHIKTIISHAHNFLPHKNLLRKVNSFLAGF